MIHRVVMFKVEVYDKKRDRSIQWKIAPLDLAVRWFESWSTVFSFASDPVVIDDDCRERLISGKQFKLTDNRRGLTLAIKQVKDGR